MKFCTNCGESVKDDGVKFCGTCGSPIPKGEGTQSAAPTSQEAATSQVIEPGLPVQPAGQDGGTPPASTGEPGQEAAPVKKKRMSKGLKVVIACVIAVAIILSAAAVVFASGAISFANPVERFRTLQRLSVFDPLASAVTVDQDEDFSTDIIINAGIEGDGFMLALISPIVEQFRIEIGIDYDAENMESMLGMAASVGGESLLSSVFTFTEEEVGLYIPELDRYYTIEMDALMSMIGGDSADMREIMEITSNFTGNEYGLLIEKYSEIILATVNSNNLDVSRNETISLFDGEEVRVTLYTFAPSEEEIFEMLMTILEEAREDDVLFALFGSTLLGLGGQPDYPARARSLRRQWDDMIVELMDDLEDAFEDGDFGVENFVWRTARAGTTLHLQEISFEIVDGRHVDEFVIRYEGLDRGDGARTDWLTIESAGTVVTFRNEMVQDAEYIEGDFGGYILERGERREVRFFEMTYQFNPEVRSILGVPYGLYEMTIWPDYVIPGSSPIPVTLEVEEGRRGGSDHLFSIRGIPDLEREGIRAITLNIHSTDEPTTMSRPTGRPIDLSGLSEWELDDIFNELGRELERYLDDIMSDFMPF